MHLARDNFVADHLRGSVDSQARFAYMLLCEGRPLDAVWRRLHALGVDVPYEEMPDLVALGETLMLARRRHG